MRLRVKVKADAKRNSVEIVKPGVLKVSVRAPRRDGEANALLRELLREYFKVPLSAVRIVSGAAEQSKTVEILGLPDMI